MTLLDQKGHVKGIQLNLHDQVPGVKPAYTTTLTEFNLQFLFSLHSQYLYSAL